MTSTADIRSRFQSGATWNLIGSVLSHGTSFLTNVLIANLLGREIFGEFGIVQSTALTSAGVAMVATGITATKYVAEFRARDRQRAGRILGLCSAVTLGTAAISTLFVWIAAPWLASTILKAPYLTHALRIAAGAIFFSVINGYQIGALSGLESFRAAAFANGAQGIAQVLLCAVGAWRWGLNGAISGLFLTTLLRWIIFHFVLAKEGAKHGICVSYSRLRSEAPVLWRFAVPAAIAGMTVAPAIWIGNALLMRQPGGRTQMALFGAAFAFKSIAVFLPWVFNSVGMAILNTQRGLGDQSSYEKVFWANIAVSGACVCVVAGLIAVSGRLLLMLYGPAFSPAYPVVLLLMGSAVLESIGLAAYQIIQAREKMWLSLLRISLPRDVGLLIAACVLVPSHQAFGLGAAHLISSGIYCVVTLATVLRLGLRLHDRSSVYPITIDRDVLAPSDLSSAEPN